MKANQMELTQRLAAVLDMAIGQGFKLPFYVTCIASNGSMIYVRYFEPEERGGLDCQVLSEFTVDEVFANPINMILVDTKQKAIRVILGPEPEKIVFH